MPVFITNSFTDLHVDEFHRKKVSLVLRHFVVVHGYQNLTKTESVSFCRIGSNAVSMPQDRGAVTQLSVRLSVSTSTNDISLDGAQSCVQLILSLIHKSHFHFTEQQTAVIKNEENINYNSWSDSHARRHFHL